MINVPVLIIIPLLNKMALLFDTSSFKGGTLLLNETVTMWRSKDVIHREPVSFLCMIHVPVLVIIPVLNKMALLFDTHSYI